MDNLLIALAAILALNLAFGLRIAISEFFSRRKDRRELGALESMWQHDPGNGVREPRRSFLARRTVAAGAAVIILSGAAFATPARDAVISTVGDVVDRLTGDQSIAASAPAPDPIPSDAAPREREVSDSDDGSRHERSNAGERGDDPASSPTASATTRPEDERSVDPSNTPEPTTPSPAPELALNPRANPVSANVIEVSWDPVPSATSYVVACSPDCPNASITVEPSSDPGPAIFDGLTPETTYRFDVTATTDLGDVHDQTSETTPPAAAAE
jgi:hypothetical protein